MKEAGTDTQIDLELIRHKETGNRCLLICNGPSLNDVDIAAASEGMTTIGLNRIYLDYIPDYLVVVNTLVLAQWGDEIDQVDTVKFLPNHYTPSQDAKGTTILIDTSRRDPSWSSELIDPETNKLVPIWEGHTVTYVALQIATHLGISMAYIVGMDHDFGEVNVEPNTRVRQMEKDQGHFRTDYFPKGSYWNTPDLRMSEYAYNLVPDPTHNLFNGGIKVINVSTRTKSKAFDLLPYSRFLYLGSVEPAVRPGLKVSAIVSAYRSHQFLEGCMDDLMSQSLFIKGDLEIVVVLKKGSWEDKFLAKDDLYDSPNIRKVYIKGKYPPLYKAWAEGCKAARGLYLTNANTDDRHADDAYEVTAGILDRRDDLDLVYHDSYITWEPNQSYVDFVNSNLGGGYLAEGLSKPGLPGIFAWPEYYRGLLSDMCFMGPQPMWRATLHQYHGHFDETYKSAGDYDFWLRIAKENNFYHIPEPLGLYYANMEGVARRDQKLTNRESWKALFDNQKILEIRKIGKEYIKLQIGGEYHTIESHRLLATIRKAKKDQEELDE